MAGDTTTDLQQWLTRAGSGVGLVFADLVDSLQLNYTKGTAVFGQMRTAYRDRANQLVMDVNGRVIDMKGDEIFAAFLSVDSAYRYARAMFEDAGHPLLTVRIGVHFGTVTYAPSGLDGRAVGFAARVLAHAQAHELWISDIAKRTLESELPAVAHEIRWVVSKTCLLKGVPEPQLLWRAA